MAWTAPKTDWSSIDGVADGDLNAIGENLVVLKAHVDEEDAPVHGSTSAETASKLVHRDASGRARVEAPDNAKDIVNKETLEAHSLKTDNPHATTKTHVALGSVDNVKQMPIAGGTFTGAAAAKAPDTDYTVAMLRNVKLLTSVPGAGDLENGQIAFVYEV